MRGVSHWVINCYGADMSEPTKKEIEAEIAMLRFQIMQLEAVLLAMEAKDEE